MKTLFITLILGSSNFLLSQTITNDTTLVDSLNQIVEGLRSTNIENNALELINQSIEHATQLNYLKGLAKGLVIKGILLKNQGNYKTSEASFRKALIIRKEQLRDSIGTASIYNNLSSLEEKRSNYSKAIEYSNKAIEILKNTNHTKWLGRAYINLGNVFQAANLLEEPSKWYQKALNVLTIKTDAEGVAIARENLATLYSIEEQYEKALNNYKKASLIYLNLNQVQVSCPD